MEHSTRTTERYVCSSRSEWNLCLTAHDPLQLFASVPSGADCRKTEHSHSLPFLYIFSFRGQLQYLLRFHVRLSAIFNPNVPPGWRSSLNVFGPYNHAMSRQLGYRRIAPYPDLLKSPQVRLSFHLREWSIASKTAIGLCLLLDGEIPCFTDQLCKACVVKNSKLVGHRVTTAFSVSNIKFARLLQMSVTN